MKSPINTGYSPSNRWSFDHQIAKKPSVWSEIVARPHLIVAAIGTFALVGMSGTAIWMALPDAQPQVIAVKSKQAAPVATAEAPAPATKPKPTVTTAAKPQAVETASMTAAPVVAAPAPQQTAAAEPVPLLDAKNPRWVDGAGNPVKPSTQAAKSTDAGDDGSLESAYADDPDAAQDASATAAIPNFNSDPGAGAGETAKPEEKTASAANGTGRILRAVTMRSKPSSRGGPIGTIPAKTQVEVVSCSKWCEVVYKGKRGFIYRSFMSKGSR